MLKQRQTILHIFAIGVCYLRKYTPYTYVATLPNPNEHTYTRIHKHIHINKYIVAVLMATCTERLFLYKDHLKIPQIRSLHTNLPL